MVKIHDSEWGCLRGLGCTRGVERRGVPNVASAVHPQALSLLPATTPPRAVAAAGGFAGAEEEFARFVHERVVSSSTACRDLSWFSVELILTMVEENKKKTPTSSNEKFCFVQLTHTQTHLKFYNMLILSHCLPQARKKYSL